MGRTKLFIAYVILFLVFEEFGYMLHDRQFWVIAAIFWIVPHPIAVLFFCLQVTILNFIVGAIIVFGATRLINYGRPKNLLFSFIIYLLLLCGIYASANLDYFRNLASERNFMAV